MTIQPTHTQVSAITENKTPPLSPFNPAYEKFYSKSTISSAQASSVCIQVSHPETLSLACATEILKTSQNEYAMEYKNREVLKKHSTLDSMETLHKLPHRIQQQIKCGYDERPCSLLYQETLPSRFTFVLATLECFALNFEDLAAAVSSSFEDFEDFLKLHASNFHTELLNTDFFLGKQLGFLRLNTFYEKMHASPNEVINSLNHHRATTMNEWELS